MLNLFKNWLKNSNAASHKSYCNFRSFLGFPCSTKEQLRFARKSDVHGNYDIDGMSYDGDSLFAGGRMEELK